MKKFIDTKDTIIDYGFVPDAESAKALKSDEPAMILHRAKVTEIRIHDVTRDRGMAKVTTLDVEHLREILKAVDEIEAQEANMLYENLPF